jgi:DNA repair protein RadA/Sms
MILAVLERRAGVRLSDQDVYVSTVGGVRLVEPGADLAIAIAIASAVRGQAVRHDIAAVGELSLAGEVRPVTSVAHRRAEATRLGYKTIIDEGSGSLTGALRDLTVRPVRPIREEVPAF